MTNKKIIASVLEQLLCDLLAEAPLPVVHDAKLRKAMWTGKDTLNAPSKDGLSGIWMVANKTVSGEALIVKPIRRSHPLSYPCREGFGLEVVRRLSHVAPDYHFVHGKDPEFQVLSDFMAPDAVYQKKYGDREPHAYLLQTCLIGRNMRVVNESPEESALFNTFREKLLVEIGEMIALDFLLFNTDRMGQFGTPINWGNVFVVEDEKNVPTIAYIDQMMGHAERTSRLFGKTTTLTVQAKQFGNFLRNPRPLCTAVLKQLPARPRPEFDPNLTVDALTEINDTYTKAVEEDHTLLEVAIINRLDGLFKTFTRSFLQEIDDKFSDFYSGNDSVDIERVFKDSQLLRILFHTEKMRGAR
ncbi:MAG: hypothetical protein ACI9BD_000095 [Candidatus Marinamargulisbacteria bacterium]|jgi:hypothetical protein